MPTEGLIGTDCELGWGLMQCFPSLDKWTSLDSGCYKDKIRVLYIRFNSDISTDFKTGGHQLRLWGKQTQALN